MLAPRGEVETCALVNSWRGARVRIPRPQGLRSICLLTSLDQLEAVVAFLQAICCGPKPALEALLLNGILRHDKFFITEAHLVFGERHVIVLL